MMKVQASIFSLFQICHFLFIYLLKVTTIQGKILGSSKLLTMSSSNIAIVFADSTVPLINKISETHFEKPVDKQLTLIQSLKRFTEESQAPFLSFLRLFEPQIFIQPMWASNVIFVRGMTPAILIALMNHPLVNKLAQIREQALITLPTMLATLQPTAPTLETPAWGVKMINAPQSWPTANGTGSIVATIDSGCNVNHEALKDNYYGVKGDEGGWFDPTVSKLNATKEPNDFQGHGSHCMGSICGAHGTGVAPGARWISTKGCVATSCLEDHLSACGQWLVSCNDGKDKDIGCPNKPHVISCSWGGDDSPTDDFYNDIIALWIKCDIFPVFANGNSGPDCSSTGYPASNQNVCSVGSTNINDQVSSFSSRGPTLKGQMAPKVCAPGEKITSCDFKTNNAYVFMSGTSMATPHVAGAACVLKSLCPGATPSDLMNVLMSSTNTEVGKPGTCNNNVTPSNECGNGRINLFDALILLTESVVCKK